MGAGERFAATAGMSGRDVLAVFSPWILEDLDALADEFAELDEDGVGTHAGAEETTAKLADLFAADYESAVGAL